MDRPNLLYAADSMTDSSLVRERLEGEGYPVRVVHSLDSVLLSVDRDPGGIILMSSSLAVDRGGDSPPPISLIRSKCLGNPHQIVLLVDNGSDLDEVADLGADDFIARPYDQMEVAARLNAAMIRLLNEKQLLEEREFFRMAVRQEEELSSRILDQHVNLKQAFESIENLNKELEESNRRLEQIAKHDVLSGLLNRMSLFTLMDVEIERSIRANNPLSGIMMDLDHFKDINDNYGHPHGDEVIRVIGQRLRDSLRKYDHAGRYGGEEFYVILPNTYLDQAYTIAERFRSKLENEPILFDGDTIWVTASLGIAQFHAGESRELWITRADKAMYQAKQEGRNRVVSE